MWRLCLPLLVLLVIVKGYVAVSTYRLCIDGSGDICIDGSGDPCVEAIGADDPGTCGGCTPPLDFEYTVTLSGLAGDFDYFNGIWTVSYRGFCVWGANETGTAGDVFLTARGGGDWDIQVITQSGCDIFFDASPGACDPTGSYTVNLGISTCLNCDDTNSCTNSSGSSCTVGDAE